MNILCDMEKPLDLTEITGWGKVFLNIGHNFLFIKRNEKAILDAFEEKKPDIFISHIDLINRATKKAIQNNKNCKAIIFVNTDEDKQKIEDHSNTFFISKNNLQDIFYIKPSCDIHLCFNINIDLNMVSDICYVGDYIKDDIFSKCFEMFRFKCWGNTKWPTPKFLGKIKDEKIKNIIFSSHMSIFTNNCKNYNWPLYVYLCNKPLLNYKNETLKNFINNSQLYFEDEDEFLKTIISIISNPDMIQENVETNKSFILNNHLSYHIVSGILKNIGMSEDADKCLNVVEKIIQKY